MLQDEERIPAGAAAAPPKETTAKEAEAEAPRSTGFEEFGRADIRVGRITEARIHEGARKPMYVLSVDLGRELGARTIVAGIREFYSPEELIGKKIACLVNLEPKQIAGVVSNGMVLAAESGGRVSLLVPDRSAEIEEGSRVR
jgi:methionine--tRNA ligase beta chain